MNISEKGAQALKALRETPEHRRITGIAYQAAREGQESKGCACAWLALGAGIPLEGNPDTYTLIREIVAATGIPLHIMNTVPALNDSTPISTDANGPQFSTKFSFDQIADVIWLQVAAYKPYST